MLKLGAHQSIAGGFDKAIEKVVKIGGNCLQIFSSSPRGWSFTQLNNEEINQFINKAETLLISPIYFHASYLINLADEDKIGKLSKQSLIHELNIAKKLKIKGSIVHLGSYKNKSRTSKYQILINNIKEILEKTPQETLFIIENAGTRKIGQNLEEISQIFKDINSPRLRLCLDTCHLFSNGYKFETKQELDEFIKKLEKLNLIDKLEVWHLNDSRDPFNSGKDRHENIGQGKIGTKEFKLLLNHPKTKNYPFIIETPGFSQEGPDKKNLDILKSLIE